MKNINIYIENNTNNLWVRRNDSVYILSRDEINGIISVFIDEKKTNGPSEISDLFDFNEILFDEEDLIFDLDEQEDLENFQNALKTYSKPLTDLEVENFIKCLIFEKLIEDRENIYDILDKDFLVELIEAYKYNLSK